MILEFTTQSSAEACLAAINSMAAGYWVDQGFTVTNGELIGKKNGVDNPSATPTITWDTVQESPDGTFYFTSLTGTPYEVGMEQLSALFTFTEKEIPEEWTPDID